jgi:hypothetical protein
MLRTLLASAVLLIVGLPASAQTTYSTARDTLRFRETTQMRMTLTMPQGEIPMTVEQRSTVALVRMPGDSARAWFDSLSIAIAGPQGEQRPPTDSALKLPLAFRLDARGRVSDVVPPKWPESLQGMADPSHHFDDFFMRLPAQPLRVGLAWSDTTTITDSTADRFSRWVRRTDYRVERDTTVGTTAALVVRTKQSMSATVSVPVPNQGMRSDASLSGEADGFYVFAPTTGRLVGRRTEGKLEGPVKLSGAAGEMQISQSFVITSAMDAVR